MVFLVLAGFLATAAIAEDDPVEQLAQRITKALSDVRKNHHELEQDLVSSGLSAQDADRAINDLVGGLVRCLLDQYRAYTEEHGESFSDKPSRMRTSLDQSGPLPLVKELAIIAQTRNKGGDLCAMNEMQKAGISVEDLD